MIFVTYVHETAPSYMEASKGTFPDENPTRAFNIKVECTYEGVRVVAGAMDVRSGHRQDGVPGGEVEGRWVHPLVFSRRKKEMKEIAGHSAFVTAN